MQSQSTTVNLGAVMKTASSLEADENLMLRYCEGDAAAFEILYTRHKAALFRYFDRQCLNQSIAEELFQETWMSIINARSNYVTTAKFTTYMYSIAHNKLIDFYRNANVRFSDHNRCCEMTSETQLDTLAADGGIQPENIVSKQQQASRLKAAIKRLPESQRETFLLREELGLDLNDIAKITKVSKEAAKSRLRYAVKNLTKMIQAGES